MKYLKNLKTLMGMLCVVAMLLLTACASGGTQEPASQGDAPNLVSEAGEEVNSDNASDDATEKQEQRAKDLTPYEKFEAISKTLNPGLLEDSQVDLDMTLVVDITVELMGETMSMPIEMSGNIKTIIENGIIKYSSVMETSDIMGTGEGSIIEMQFDGENGFYAVDGMEIEMSYDQMMEQINSSAAMPELGEEAILSSETVKVGDNEETTMVLSGQYLTKFMLDQMGEEFAQLGENAQISVDDATMVIVTTADETPVSLSMVMDMNMLVSDPEYGFDMNMDMSMTMSYVINKFGSGVEVDLSKLG